MCVVESHRETQGLDTQFRRLETRGGEQHLHAFQLPKKHTFKQNKIILQGPKVESKGVIKQMWNQGVVLSHGLDPGTELAEHIA